MGAATRLGLVRPDEPEPQGTASAAAAPWYRRRRVHLALGVLVAVLAALLAGIRAAEGVRATIDERLRDAGAGADAALVSVEAEQLSALRAATFTQGVGRALATHDIATLNRLVTPVHANSGVPMLDVVLPDGRVALAVRSRGAPAPVASRAGMTAVAKALRDARGPRAGRFSQVVVLRSGPTFVTAGPVLSGKETVGVVLAMTPLADVLGRLSQELRVTLTAYDLGGAPIATTAADVPARIDRTTARALASGGPIAMRSGREREALGRLIVDHQPNALLGVALEDDSWETGRAVIGYVVLGLLCTVVIAGSYGIRLGRRLRG